jgi:hypothetical protein
MSWALREPGGGAPLPPSREGEGSGEKGVIYLLARVSTPSHPGGGGAAWKRRQRSAKSAAGPSPPAAASAAKAA